jgi:hypothetical protein
MKIIRPARQIKTAPPSWVGVRFECPECHLIGEIEQNDRTIPTQAHVKHLLAHTHFVRCPSDCGELIYLTLDPQPHAIDFNGRDITPS